MARRGDAKLACRRRDSQSLRGLWTWTYYTHISHALASGRRSEVYELDDQFLPPSYHFPHRSTLMR